MLLIPAIDIKNGKCVRLSQGRMESETIYSEWPLAMAERWIKAGAQRLHIVDLDGAIAGKPANSSIVKEVTAAFPNTTIQVGGGIRDEDTIQTYLEAGVNYVIIGTKAITTPHFVANACLEFPGRIIVGLDAKDGKLATDGWSKLSQHETADVAKRFEDNGVSAIIFTDINRDGMMNKVNLDATVELCQQITTPVIASGGITNVEDIRSLCKVADEGIAGAIIGRAIYEGSLDFVEALQLVSELNNK